MKTADTNKILITIIIIIIGSVFSYRVGIIDTILMKHSMQIEKLQAKDDN